MTLIGTPDNMPSAHQITLPSRAFLFSWRDQNLPARHAALEDSVAHYAECAAGDEAAWRDMALLGVIADAMQPLEDFAMLASAWDSPQTGLAHYLRATEWTRFGTNNFWQEAPKWADERLDALAGHAFRDPVTGQSTPMLTALSGTEGVSTADLSSLDAARDATRARLRRLLPELASDWKRFSPYFLAFKHGGLTLSREGLVIVDDDVTEIVQDTPTGTVAIAVWPRSLKRQDIVGNIDDDPDEFAHAAAGSGRLALDLVDAFLDSRTAIFESIELDDRGEVRALAPLQLPWTVWLSDQDLDKEHWQRLGRGPRISWGEDPGPPAATDAE